MSRTVATIPSARVKGCDTHPSEPWVLLAKYDGTLAIVNTDSQEVVLAVKASESPIRCARFIGREGWIACGSDDQHVYIFEIKSGQRLIKFKAHDDFVRSIDVHPTQPYLLTAGDDKVAKVWDWTAEWICTQILIGHDHYVMHARWNPADLSCIATASLDKCIKLWNLGVDEPIATFAGCEQCVNALTFADVGGKMLLIAAGDEGELKVWDCSAKCCIASPEGHTANVTAACFDAAQSLIVTGAEDGTIPTWNAGSFTLESTFHADLGRCWALTLAKANSPTVVGGFDNGAAFTDISVDTLAAHIA